MSDPVAKKEEPNIPDRLTNIEELLGSAHGAVARMLPSSGATTDTVAEEGIEASTIRIENGLRDLLGRINTVVARVGRL